MGPDVRGEYKRRRPKSSSEICACVGHAAKVSVQVFAFDRPMVGKAEFGAAAGNPADPIFINAAVLSGGGKGICKYLFILEVGEGQGVCAIEHNRPESQTYASAVVV